MRFFNKNYKSSIIQVLFYSKTGIKAILTKYPKNTEL